MIRLLLVTSLATSTVAVPATVAMPTMMLAPAPETTSSDPKKDQDNLDEEFGDHDRPWAEDALGNEEVVDTSKPPERRGLAQSQREIEESLKRNELPIPAARVSSMAAVTEVLATISKEREQLREEWSTLADYKAEVALANRRALEEIDRLRDLRTEVLALIDELETKEDENLEKVVAVVANMSSKNAARLLEQNDTRFIVNVFDKLGERASAEILSKMTPRRANEVMGAMANRGRPDQSVAAL
ncbi:MAG: hypothetical protein AAF225_06935 [Pseudomonadota bacterium]